MRLRHLLSAVLLAASSVSAASAATFTPDMWVYEVTFTPESTIIPEFFAWATAPLGTAVPEGCYDDGVLPSGEMSVACDRNPGIDLIASAGLDRPEQVMIGFDAAGVVCDTSLWECNGTPATASTRSLTALPVFDAVLGTLNLCGSTDYGGSYGCVTATPWGVTGHRHDEASLGGHWDFGYGGIWGGGFISTLSYAVTGRLVSAPTTPTPVPLPAGLPLLALGLASFGLMRRRGV